MPSPFPGMDPYIESQEWTDFHPRFNVEITDLLTPQLGERYIARVERRIYVEHNPEVRRRFFSADVAVLEEGGAERTLSAGPATIAPVECVLPPPVERQESYVVVRERHSREVVTVMEVLSPTNKIPGSDGRRLYLEKRDAILESRTHLVELDLLRGGARLPLEGSVPAGDYYALVSREQRRPKVDVYAWTLRHRLPSIPIPLKPEDGEVLLDLHQALDSVYDRVRYDNSIDYASQVDPPLSREDTEWVTSILTR